MAEEGVAQIFRPVFGSWPILGAVVTLQLDVLVSRLDQEYGVPIKLEPAPFETARWITSDNPDLIRKFCESYRSSIAEDKDLSLVFLAKNAWTLNRAMEEWPDIHFHKVRER
jgi:peptide chain release factor 3